jgi:hypothetical protein
MLFNSIDVKNQEDLDLFPSILSLCIATKLQLANKARNEKYQELFMPSRDISHELNNMRRLVWFIVVGRLAPYTYLQWRTY